MSLDYAGRHPIMVSQLIARDYGYWREAMKAFVVACVAVVVIAIGAAMVLDRYQEPAGTAFASPSGVRI